MFRKLFTILALLMAPAFAQELPPTYVNTGNLYSTQYGEEAISLVNGISPYTSIGLGNVVIDQDDWNYDNSYYQFSFTPGQIVADADLTQLQINNLTVFLSSFAFKFDCNNSIGGSCENPFGPQDWLSAKMELYTTEGFFGAWDFWTGQRLDQGQLATQFYGWNAQFLPTQWYGFVAYQNSAFTDLTSETAYFTTARLIISGQDAGFWGGLYGPKIDSFGIQVEYDSATQGLILPPLAPDCTVDVTDPTCIINALTDPTEEPVMVADESTQPSEENTDEEPVDEEVLAAVEETVVEESPANELLEESLEELLDEETDEEQLVASEAAVSVKEMVNEEKAVTLSDSISKDVLESALSIAAAVDANSSSTNSTESSSSSSSSSSRSTSISSSTSETTVAADTSSSTTSTVDNSTQESTSAGDASMELLETGRAIGQEALASTMASTEASASDSLSQAESVAQTSSLDSISASSSTAEIINSIEIESVIDTATIESQTETSIETMVAAETQNNETGSGADAQDFLAAENNSSAASNQEADDVAFAVVNNSISSSEQKTFEDETNTDAEVTNAMVDPALAMANTFNQPPSMMNLEILGIVKPIEEKSDAERSAERVVAANKEEQDAINANYMDADQSGIVAAIGADADVSTYLSARLMDNNVWYKPEDIYKNIVIKDNVRGSYFLEKGNTDTYKKMVEEQYKDE